MAVGPRQRGASPPVLLSTARSALVAVGGLLLFAVFLVPGSTERTEQIEPVVQVTPMCEDVYDTDAVNRARTPAQHHPDDWADWAEDLHAWAEAEAPDRFAGSWGGTVAFTGDVEMLAEHVHERFGDDLEVIEVDHTEEDLEVVARAATQELLDQRQTRFGGPVRPGDLVDVTVVVRANRVRLRVVGLDDDRAAGLTDRYGATRICLEDAPLPELEERETISPGIVPATRRG